MTNSLKVAAPITTDEKGFKKSLGLLDATMIVAVSMIGSAQDKKNLSWLRKIIRQMKK